MWRLISHWLTHLARRVQSCQEAGKEKERERERGRERETERERERERGGGSKLGKRRKSFENFPHKRSEKPPSFSLSLSLL